MENQTSFLEDIAIRRHVRTQSVVCCVHLLIRPGFNDPYRLWNSVLFSKHKYFRVTDELHVYVKKISS